MVKVKDIMTKGIIAVRSEDKVEIVARLLNKHNIHGVPVVKNKKLVGVITESDFFIKDFSTLYLPSYIEFLKKARFVKNLSGKQKKQTSELLEAKAEDIMTKDCLSVLPDISVNKLIEIFKEKRVYTFPVVNKNNEVVGVVTLADIIKLI